MTLLESFACFLLCVWLLLPSSTSQETNFGFDADLLESLLLSSSLSAYNQDFKDRVLNGNTETLQELTNKTREYLETIPFTNELLNGLSEIDDVFNNDEIKRIVHWMHIFEVLSEWSKDQSSEDLLGWVSFTDNYLENFCDTFLISPSQTTELEQSLGANKTSCLKAVTPDFFYMKYLGVRAFYVRMLESDNLAADITYFLTLNIYEAVFTGWERRRVNAMIGDRLVAMYRGLPIFAGRNCTSLGCAKNVIDEEICKSSFDSDHVQRNCTVNQDYINYYIEWNMNFVVSETVNLWDTVIAKLLYPALREDVSAFLYERVQSLHYTGCVTLIRSFLNPLKSRAYFSMDKVNEHAVSVLNNWTKNDPNLTTWTDIDYPPANGLDPAVDPANAEVGDWMNYFTGLYPVFPSYSSVSFAQIVTFIRIRLFFGICISSDVV